MQAIRSNKRDIAFLPETRRVSWEELINLDDVPRSWFDAAAFAIVSSTAVLPPASLSRAKPYAQPLVVETASPFVHPPSCSTPPNLRPACCSTPALPPASIPAPYAQPLVVDTQGNIHAPTPFPSPVLGMLDYPNPTHAYINNFRPVDDGWIAESARANGVGRVSSSATTDVWCGKLLTVHRSLSPLSDVSFSDDDCSEYSDSDDEEMEFLNEAEFDEEFEV